jgi:DNA-binding SARP family transcriptional activator/Tfp pilus assembly protein PilF
VGDVVVEFELLGDLVVRADGREIDVGHARQAGVLMTLVIDANRVVSADQLLYRVWGDRMPRRGRETLASYVSRLRRALAFSSEVSIDWRAGGYVLGIEPLTADVHRFRRGIAEARSSEDDQRALVLFDQALGLWRGTAFPVLDTDWINALRDTLHRERLAAEIDRTDIALRLGRHNQELVELQDRVARHPLDERLAGQVILALYRAGRPAEALQHFRETHRRLTEELGIDPGDVLRQLHQRILAADPDLAATGNRSAPVAPRQLPAPPWTFTGRAAELAHLDTALRADGGRTPISTVNGPAGVGKTWLALRWAHTRADRYPDGQLFVDLHGFDSAGDPLPAEAAVRGFLDALGVAAPDIPADPQAQIGAYRSLLAGRSMLIIVDNARDADQVTPLLPGSPTCAVLVTSRNQLTGLTATHGTQPLSVDALDDTGARELLIGHLGHDRVAAEPEAITGLLDTCAGLPLALSIVAARAATHPHFPLSVLARELHETAHRLDALDAGGLTTNLRTVLSHSYQALSADAASVFALIGLVPRPTTSLPAVAGLAAIAPHHARVHLRELEAASLVREHLPGRYQIHDLLWLYAADRARQALPVEHLESAQRRLVDYYLHNAHAAERLLHPHRQPIELAAPAPGCRIDPPADETAALTWLTDEHADLLACQQLANTHHWYDAVWQLAWSLDTFHRRQGHVHSHLAAWRAGLAAARHLANQAPVIMAHRNLGIACLRADLHGEALENLHEALDLARQAENADGQFHTHLTLAYAWERQEDNQRALDHATQALLLIQSADHPVWEAQVHNQTGLYSTRLGRHDQARTHFKTALDLFRTAAERDGEADVLGNMGYLAHRVGDYAQAVKHYLLSLPLLREIGHAYEEANTLERLGEAHAALGRHAEADAAWTQAHSLFLAQKRPQDAERLHELLELRPA